MSAPENLITPLHDLLLDLHEHQYPIVPNPQSTPRRASVALIIRINPRYETWPAAESSSTLISTSTSTSTSATASASEAAPPQGQTVQARLKSFFAQEWVQHGEPEVLFIKRASRQGDRWTGHVAFPGGRRDPEDEDDYAAAVRETAEEVGIDLGEGNAVPVGNLPQRLITTTWGKTPIMILCPYVFLIHRHELPPLRLQPTEVASAHWVPIRSLLDPSVRTHEYQDVSSRYGRNSELPKKLFMRYMMGQMIFAAIRLVPSQSFYSSNPAGSSFIQSKAGPFEAFTRSHLNRKGSPPALLWGLTMGVMIDFLEMLPPHNTVELWSCPTFTPWDIRLLIWFMSRNFMKRKRDELRVDLQALHEVQFPSERDRSPGPIDGTVEDAGYGENGPPTEFIGKLRRPNSSILHSLLSGYFVIIHRALFWAFLGRAVAAVGLGYFAFQRLRQNPPGWFQHFLRRT